VHEIEGYCRRLDTLQAAVLGVKLPHLDQWNGQRRRAAALYSERLAGLPEVVTPGVLPGTESVFHLYVVQVPYRDAMRSALTAAGIETGIHYPIPLHEQPAYAHMGLLPEAFPVSHRLAPAILSLPMFPEITTDQIDRVVGVMQGVLAAV
jgi:dTDP-4-amino-4,6-dideoxygalactose transaminase